jgi:early secretory antigenic target protein ESAT-6
VDNFRGAFLIRASLVQRREHARRNGKQGETMSHYEVDSTQVAAASAAVQTSAQELGDEVDRMMRRLLELQASWKGSASTSFQHVVTDWRATQERVRLTLEEIQRALAIAGRQYEEAETTATRMFTG